MSGQHDAAIRVRLLERIHAERPRSFIVQEWAFLRSIADVGVIGDGAVDAFEIKSAADSTARLAQQAADYSRVFSRCTLVAARAHLRAAAKLLPGWWGIVVAEPAQLVVERAPLPNPAPNLAELLWSAEAAKLCRARGLYAAALERQREEFAGYAWAASVKRPYRSSLVKALQGSPELAGSVCAILRGRQSWRLPDGRSQRGAEIREMRAENARRLAR